MLTSFVMLTSFALMAQALGRSVAPPPPSLSSGQDFVSCFPKSAKVDELLTRSSRHVDFLLGIGAETRCTGKRDFSALVVWMKSLLVARGHLQDCCGILPAASATLTLLIASARKLVAEGLEGVGLFVTAD